MTQIKLDKLSKRYHEREVLRALDLTFAKQETTFLVGGSGCGKSTILRLIAGLEAPDSGEIWFDEERVTAKPPYKRNIGMVFQSYALWPHMSVHENLNFGLKARRIIKKERVSRIKAMLERLNLLEFEHSMPQILSGGQQQRVAIGRAFIVRPRVLLLDEPLANLNEELRLSILQLLKELQNEVRPTTVYVTHSPKEATILGGTVIEITPP
jgi:ABC-type sugar transport system ATPase subunit